MRTGTLLAAAAAALLIKPKVQPRNRLNLPSFRGVAEVRASIPGRIRLYMPAVSAQTALAEKMKEQMEATVAVRKVSVNPSTGTVLFEYDESQVEGAVVEGAAIRLMGLDALIQKEPVSKMESGLSNLWSSVNHGVLEATNGWMDARMLAGSAVTAAAVRSFMRQGAGLPGAITLLWWASNIFRRSSHD